MHIAQDNPHMPLPSRNTFACASKALDLTQGTAGSTQLQSSKLAAYHSVPILVSLCDAPLVHYSPVGAPTGNNQHTSLNPRPPLLPNSSAPNNQTAPGSTHTHAPVQHVRERQEECEVPEHSHPRLQQLQQLD